MQQSKQKATVWVIIAFVSGYLWVMALGNSIFPPIDVTPPAHSQRIVNGQIINYDKNGRSIKPAYQSNPINMLVRIFAGLLFIVAYWQILGLVIPMPGVRLIVFLVSIPIGYMVFVAMAFATIFGN